MLLSFITKPHKQTHTNTQTHIMTSNTYHYFRVVVDQILGSTMFLICYCDYGDIVMVNSDRLKMLPAKFRTLPRLAISAKLYGKYFKLLYYFTFFNYLKKKLFLIVYCVI